MKPLCIDLFCGIGGWAEGFLSEGYRVVGFDIERHRYEPGEEYPAQLIIQDVLTLHGKQFKDAAVIVASPPCQNYSYLAMPWSRSKGDGSQKAKAMRRKWETEGPDNRLFDACFRIQREASEAAGRYIPLVVENVKGAQPWVGSARGRYGSFYLWGDVPALMPEHYRCRCGAQFPLSLGKYGCASACGAAIKQSGLPGPEWFNKGAAAFDSKSPARKRASALIAKIPFELARHIARTYKP